MTSRAPVPSSVPHHSSRPRIRNQDPRVVQFKLEYLVPSGNVVQYPREERPSSEGGQSASGAVTASLPDTLML